MTNSRPLKALAGFMTQNVLRGQTTLTGYSHRANGSKSPHTGLVCMPGQASTISETENRAHAEHRRTVLYLHAGERLYDLGWQRNFHRTILSHPLFKEALQP